MEGDPTCLYNAAQALRTIQQLYGIIPRVYGKGNAAKQVSGHHSNFYFISLYRRLLDIGLSESIPPHTVLHLPHPPAIFLWLSVQRVRGRLKCLYKPIKNLFLCLLNLVVVLTSYWCSWRLGHLISIS